jgi:hypothetical protein
MPHQGAARVPCRSPLGWCCPIGVVLGPGALQIFRVAIEQAEAYIARKEIPPDFLNSNLVPAQASEAPAESSPASAQAAARLPTALAATPFRAHAAAAASLGSPSKRKQHSTASLTPITFHGLDDPNLDPVLAAKRRRQAKVIHALGFGTPHPSALRR